ncbi:class I SAM-dependent methyltransferase [Phaeacidiphilus oryzae]|uniref:class I SAM-dependent methyltransferase n=1 Tax=Phaeacidiphilus oryzae TaxID=348818 RepID=UPI00056CADC5|nr:methyltransferase domain-containing protein [Phaeacidiphilus oryzae]
MSERAVYTHGHHESVLRSHRWRTVENSAGYLLPHLRPGQALLDVGCGPGTITAGLAKAVAAGTGPATGGGRLTAVDTAGDVLAAARSELAAQGVAAEDGATDGGDGGDGGAVRLEVADVHALPYPDDSFDVVHAHQVLQHLSDPVQALREMRRVCRPGGIVAARDADYAAMCWYPRPPELDEWNDLYHRIARANGGEPDAGRRMPAWARAAGFPPELVTVTADTWCYAGPEDREWWGGMWADRVVGSAFARQAVADGFTSQERLEALSAAWRAWSADPDGYFAIINTELLLRA